MTQRKRTLLFEEGLAGLLRPASAVLSPLLGAAERQVRRRLARLRERLERIGESGDLSARVPVEGGDELAPLAASVNELLAALQRAQEARRESDQRYQAVVGQASEGIFLLALDTGRFLEVNEAFLQLVGYTEAQLRELTLNEVMVWAAGAPPPLAAGRAALTGEQCYRRQGGRLVYVEVTANRIPHEGRQVLCAVVRDITERKRAEEVRRRAHVELEERVRARTAELAASNEALQAEIAERARAEQKYRSIFENAVEGIFRTTPEGRYLAANPALARIYGYDSPEELIERMTDISGQLYVEPGRRAEFVRLMAEQGTVSNFVSEVYRKDGSVVWVRENARCVPGEDDGPACFEGTVEDVTDARLVGEQLRQSQKMEAVGRLAGGVAHDFNNVLAVILGYGDLLLDSERVRGEDREAVEEIRQAAERAAGLTRQLLAFSRKQAREPRPLNLAEVLGGLEKMLGRLLGADVELATLSAPGLGQVKADPSQVEQVIMNLAVNARDAMPQGGKLTMELSNVRLEEEYAWRHAGVSAGEYVLLAVTDTGCGMDEATRARIFEPFFTTKEPGKGTGLGLATVYGVIQQSRGHIWVYSEPGQGTTFKLYFPRLDAPEDPASRSRRLALESPPARGAETVLLVEDDPSLRELAATLLRAQGYQVLPAADGPAALALCEARGGEINLLLTDLVMPGMSGRELAEAVAARWAEIPVLYVSGYTDDAVVRHGLLTSGIAFLQKPFTPAQLATRVRQVLDARPERKTAPSG